jgi:hypothetical protein
MDTYVQIRRCTYVRTYMCTYMHVRTHIRTYVGICTYELIYARLPGGNCNLLANVHNREGVNLRRTQLRANPPHIVQQLIQSLPDRPRLVAPLRHRAGHIVNYRGLRGAALIVYLMTVMPHKRHHHVLYYRELRGAALIVYLMTVMPHKRHHHVLHPNHVSQAVVLTASHRMILTSVPVPSGLIAIRTMIPNWMVTAAWWTTVIRITQIDRLVSYSPDGVTFGIRRTLALTCPSCTEQLNKLQS